MRKYRVLTVKVDEELYHRLKAEKRRRLRKALDREQDELVSMSEIIIEALEEKLGYTEKEAEN